MPQVNLLEDRVSHTMDKHIDIQQISIKSSVDEDHSTYCNPNKLKVNSAIRMDSVRPLIEGEPTHLAACGMSIAVLLNLP
jgi:hypothetical protein